MTADEIRKLFNLHSPGFEPQLETDFRMAQVAVMGEIAAQLAELKVEVSRLADNVILAAGKRVTRRVPPLGGRTWSRNQGNAEWLNR